MYALRSFGIHRSLHAMENQPTHRGFSYYKFQDYYRQPCSIQKSSLMDPECIWLGREIDGVVADRMHLTQDMVRDLLPLLQHFAETGELPNHWAAHSITEKQ